MAEAGILERLSALEQRGQAHREALQASRAARSGRRGVAFRLGGHDLLVDLAAVDEISPALPWTPLPGAAQWFIGLVNRRGELLTLVDLGAWLWGEPAPEGGDLLVLRRGAVATALRVDDVVGIRAFEEEQCRKPAELPGRAAHFQEVAWADDETVWNQIALSALLEDPAFLEAGGTIKEDA
ncbi:twitching motility protein PilI [Thiohalospira halophila DSM 15071]|jgi:chemotaxis signal transduction protein|uniref:Twitching motility protein PilI n=1 Tax=Thiohalospira halophila DSM 15071 TaxID=1123397 RepID=A0A1I1SG21_9GAMM|nr:chemotaxis protein CheW [Thiohalospira halophila]SFD45444.1 twitching motility protein PilI [Thiohalospira halophila DSM 15071]